MLLPWVSNPAGPPVGRQDGGCWMPFEYAHSGRCRMQLTPCCAVSGEVALPSYSDTCDLPVALRRWSPAGSYIIGTWSASESGGWAPLMGRGIVTAKPGPVGAAQVRFGGIPDPGRGRRWGTQAHGG